MAGLHDGPLWGQLAWADTGDGDDDPPVIAGNLSQDNSGGVQAAYTPISLVPQSSSFTVTTTFFCGALSIGQHNDSDILLAWPNGATEFIAVDPGVIFHNATHGAWNIHIEDDLGTAVDIPTGNFPYSTTHTCKFVFTGTNVESFWDGVSVGNTTVRNPATLPTWSISWFIDATQAANTWRTSALTVQ